MNIIQRVKAPTPKFRTRPVRCQRRAARSTGGVTRSRRHDRELCRGTPVNDRQSNALAIIKVKP